MTDKSEWKNCTEAHPMPAGDEGRWIHRDARMIYDDYAGLAGGGDWERYECPNCGKRFWVELPD